MVRFVSKAAKTFHVFCKFHEKLELLIDGDIYKGQNIFELCECIMTLNDYLPVLIILSSAIFNAIIR